MTFNEYFAKDYGVNEAIVFHNLIYWCQYNQKRNVNFYDGHYWTYNSCESFSKIFPCFNSKQMYRILANLKEYGLIIDGNYNKLKYDRTKWYAITDFGIAEYNRCESLTFANPDGICTSSENEQSISRKEIIHFPKKENQLPENVQPIPDINTDIKPNINTDNKQKKETKKKTTSKNNKAPLFDRIKEYTQNEELREVLNKYLQFKLSTRSNFTLDQWNILLEDLARYGRGNDKKMIAKVKSSYSKGYQAIVYENEIEKDNDSKSSYYDSRNIGKSECDRIKDNDIPMDF